MRRLLTTLAVVAALLLLAAAPALAQDSTTTSATESGTDFAAVAVQLGFAALVVKKIMERLKDAIPALKGSLVSVVAVALGFAAAYGFDLSVGANASVFIDKLFAALSVGLGAGFVNDMTTAKIEAAEKLAEL